MDCDFLSKKANRSGVSLRNMVENDPEIGPSLTVEDLNMLDHPEKYIGHAVEIVDQVVKEVEEKRKEDPEKLG